MNVTAPVPAREDPPPAARAAEETASPMGDVWGGLAASLVVLPASVAFGVAAYGPLAGPGAGALVGLLGATALGTVAPVLGGTPRLVSAPCAPALAVMGAFALQMSQQLPAQPERVLVLMTLVGLLAASIQLLLGAVGAGTIIKYIPYPVVTGYLSGVGVVILLKQGPALLGLPHGTSLGHGLLSPSLWSGPAICIGAATVTAMLLGPRLTRAVPAAVVGLLAGVLTFGLLALLRPELRTLAHNTLVVGPLTAGGPGVLAAMGTRVSALAALHLADAGAVASPAVTLAVLLSLDTLKTCVVVDAMTGSRHQSNRELLGQGAANALSAILGGMPGAGTSGPTLVNIASGGRTRWSAVLCGVMVMVAFLLLGRVVAWAPLAALAAILSVVAVRMFDFGAMGWVRQSATALDFLVVVVVIVVAVGVDLIAASAVGVALSILLFIRNEARAPVIRRRLTGADVHSRKRRLPEQVELLHRYGHETVVVELAGSLFFGTTDELRNLLEDALASARTIVVDLRRVDAIDMTAVHILAQMRAGLRKRGADMLFCHVPAQLAGRKDAARYLREVGLVVPGEVLFDQLSDALAFTEDRLLREHGRAEVSEEPAELLELPLFQGRKPDTLRALESCVERRPVACGQYVFRAGDGGDEIYFVRKGQVRISLIVGDRRLHVASFGRGDFFGEITFLDAGNRTADAIAETDTELYVLSRRRFDALADEHPRLAQSLFSHLSRSLALRLRHADREITTLEES